MVNEAAIELLHLLKHASAPVSGAALSRRLGVSRVALWKRVEALRAAGYTIEAGRAGYRLRAADTPLPWEFPGDESRTFHHRTLGSTMDEALKLGLSGVTEAAVVAERQTAGRGRADKSWVSGGGDLLVTLLVRPRLPLSYAGALALEALTCLADTLEDLYGLDVGLHWPNDLVAGDRKLAGVLVEAMGAADAPRFYTVGLGLNVHGLPPADRPTASVAALRPEADRRAILAQWRQRLGRWVAEPRPEPQRWAARTSLPGELTAFTFDGRQIRGRPQGFDTAGSLLLADSTTPFIRYGETLRTQGAS